MKTATATMHSLSPYSQSRFHGVERNNKETAKDHEERTWRERCHYNKAGELFIPPMAFKNCIAEAAKFLSMQVPGKGKATYTKHFLAGILVTDGMPLNVKKDDVEGEWQFLNSDGVRGSGKRVMKCHPVIHEWSGSITFYVLDDTITEDVFTRVLKEAGNFIGVGRFRPHNGGFYGRFAVDAVQWMDEEELADAAD